MARAISIPRTPKSAYNPKRRVSDLLKAHITNLEAVTGRGTTTGPRRKPKTEAQASAYISELTRQLHPALYASPALPAPAPPPPTAPSPAALSVAPSAARRRRTPRKRKTTARPKPSRATRSTSGAKTRKTRKKTRRAGRSTRRSSRY